MRYHWKIAFELGEGAGSGPRCRKEHGPPPKTCIVVCTICNALDLALKDHQEGKSSDTETSCDDADVVGIYEYILPEYPRISDRVGENKDSFEND